jgi:5-methylcytosine-specific restriction protein A
MMTRRQRPCLDCQRLTRNPSRCDEHQAAWQARQDQLRGSASQRGYGSAWRRTAAGVLADHRAVNGDWCPGWHVPGHVASDLTVDHLVPKARGGSDHLSNLRVLCRSCNSRKHAR